MDEKEIISQIRGLSENQIQDWINERIKYLQDTAREDREEISINRTWLRRARGEKENTEVHGFIPSTTRIKKMQHDSSAFLVDDESVYRTMVEYLSKIDEKWAMNNNYVMHLIQHIIINYFGERGVEGRRDALYELKADEGEFSIRNFRGNATAMCVERSAMAQNILAFLGYDPMLVFGYMSSDRGVTNEAHAYNCVIRNGKAMLVDFTNPINKDGKYFKPACFNVSGEDLAKFIKGKGQIETLHKDIITNNGELEEDAISLVYASDEIDPQYFEKKKQFIQGSLLRKPSQVKDVANKSGISLNEINNVTNEARQDISNEVENTTISME